MSLSLQPEIFGTVQPAPAQLTQVVLTPPNRPGHLNMFIANNESDPDRVRVQVIPAGSVPQPQHYILYDTPIVAGHTVIISQIFVNSGDTIQVYSESGACAFTVSGTAFVYA